MKIKYSFWVLILAFLAAVNISIHRIWAAIESQQNAITAIDKTVHTVSSSQHECIDKLLELLTEADK